MHQHHGPLAGFLLWFFGDDIFLRLLACLMRLTIRSRSFHSEYEEYDPGTGTFSVVGSSQLVRTTFSANLLANGKILIVAGSNSFEAVQGCELFDPTIGVSIFTDSLSVVRGFQHHSITLPDGSVFVVGGELTTTTAQPAELYTP